MNLQLPSKRKTGRVCRINSPRALTVIVVESERAGAPPLIARWIGWSGRVRTPSQLDDNFFFFFILFYFNSPRNLDCTPVVSNMVGARIWSLWVARQVLETAWIVIFHFRFFFHDNSIKWENNYAWVTFHITLKHNETVQ